MDAKFYKGLTLHWSVIRSFALISLSLLSISISTTFMRFGILLLLGISIGMLSCQKELSDEEQLRIDIEKINQYLSDHQLSADSTASGLRYIITASGSGGHPNLQSVVTVTYKGYLLDGTVFDQTDPGKTAVFSLAGLIPGWQECIPLLRKSGKGTFFLPSALGYGHKASGIIPGNSVLIFEIELVDF
jgi:FKBP-type peptidyl-prolyl cis-trans isomerase FkpA